MPTERAAVVAALNWSAEKTSQKAAARVTRGNVSFRISIR